MKIWSIYVDKDLSWNVIAYKVCLVPVDPTKTYKKWLTFGVNDMKSLYGVNNESDISKLINRNVELSTSMKIL